MFWLEYIFILNFYAFHQQRQIKSMAAQNKRIVYVGKVLFNYEALQSYLLPTFLILEYFKS